MSRLFFAARSTSAHTALQTPASWQRCRGKGDFFWGGGRKQNPGQRRRGGEGLYGKERGEYRSRLYTLFFSRNCVFLNGKHGHPTREPSSHPGARHRVQPPPLVRTARTPPRSPQIVQRPALNTDPHACHASALSVGDVGYIPEDRLTRFSSAVASSTSVARALTTANDSISVTKQVYTEQL